VVVSPAGFEPATPGLEDPYHGVYSDASVCWSPDLTRVSRIPDVCRVVTDTPYPPLLSGVVVTDTTFEPQESPVQLHHLMATQSLGLFFTSLKLPPLTRADRVGHLNFRVLFYGAFVDRWVPSH
jgi:hypothetical protein